MSPELRRGIKWGLILAPFAWLILPLTVLSLLVVYAVEATTEAARSLRGDP